MTNDRQLEVTKAYWQKAADEVCDHRNVRPMAPDQQMQSYLERCIIRYLRPEWRCLDLGCGDGLSTLKLAKHVRMVTGVDYLEKFIVRARTAAEQMGITNVSFQQGNVLELETLDLGLFDSVITIRCLINLGSWENQKYTLKKIADHLPRDGYYFACEGWIEGIEGLSKVRRRQGLPELNVGEFNVFMSRTAFEDIAARNFDIIDYHGLGFYLFMSRIFQPLFVSPDKPVHDHPINCIAGQMIQNDPSLNAEFFDYDYAGMYVLRKK